MAHWAADTPAVAVGAAVGIAAGLCTPQAVRLVLAEGEAGARQVRQLPPFAIALIVTLAAVTGALIGARFGLRACLPAYLLLAAIAPVLGAVDAAAHRLPNRVLLPAYPIGAVLLALAAWRSSDVSALWRALAAGMLLFAVFLAVALVAVPGSLGFGDVKLAGLLGGFLGFLGWATVFLGMMIAFGLAALYVLIRSLVRREQRGQVLPLGPALLVGALAAVIVR